jgi:hypothetical protein
MTLPASGAISFSNINTELGNSATAQISLNDAAVRTMFGIASGAIDMNTGHGKCSCTTPFGSTSFVLPGTYSWVAPAGIKTISVVAVGGGSGGAYRNYICNVSGGGGGGGGGLGYKNNITVTPGTSYTVVVGAGGGPNAAGGNTYFISTSTVMGGRSAYICSSYRGDGGTYVGDGGGNGGTSYTPAGGYQAAGGSGAGGYSGRGGKGWIGCNACADGAGGGGGGGIGGNAYQVGGGGGGVGIWGQGPSGTRGTDNNTGAPAYVDNKGGNGGSYGVKGGVGNCYYKGSYSGSACAYPNAGNGGLFGGGGGGQNKLTICPTNPPIGPGCGSNGALRIIWPGKKRQFPSTCTSVAADFGSIAFVKPGLYSWVAPPYVTSVSVVAIGGGAGGGTRGLHQYYGAGGGGGLGWKNNISVTPGSSYTVHVGKGGWGTTGYNPNTYSPTCCGVQGAGINGQSSYFGGNYTAYDDGNGCTATVKGFGARRTDTWNGTTNVNGGTGSGYNAPYSHGIYKGDGGGNGGQGVYYCGGGGGAGGYAGKGCIYPYSGGSGAGGGCVGNGCAGYGGGGGGGAISRNNSGTYAGGSGGGGTGIYGQGSNGAGGVASINTTATGGGGGSGGTSGASVTVLPNCGTARGGKGGLYGGGGGSGGSGTTYAGSGCCVYASGLTNVQIGGDGGDGAVRIVWPGTVRSFPSTCVGAP